MAREKGKPDRQISVTLPEKQRERLRMMAAHYQGVIQINAVILAKGIDLEWEAGGWEEKIKAGGTGG